MPQMPSIRPRARGAPARDVLLPGTLKERPVCGLPAGHAGLYGAASRRESPMLTLIAVQRRLRAFIEEIRALDRSEFPYEDSQRALRRIKGRFDLLLKQMTLLQPDADIEVIKHHANLALELCTRYLPVLGFILRSTNVRNGFELVGPLHRLAKQLLQPDHKPGEIEVRLCFHRNGSTPPCSGARWTCSTT